MNRVSSLLACAVLAGSALIAAPAQAHIPNISTFILVETADADAPWRLEVHMATSGMHAALSAHYPAERLSTIEPSDYEARLERMLRAGIDLRYVDAASEGSRARAHPIALGAVEIAIGPHTSVATFEVERLPATAELLRARVDALSISEGQQNVFRLVSQRGQSHVVLSAGNAFSSELSLVRFAEASARSLAAQELPSAARPEIAHSHDGVAHTR